VLGIVLLLNILALFLIPTPKDAAIGH